MKSLNPINDIVRVNDLRHELRIHNKNRRISGLNGICHCSYLENKRETTLAKYFGVKVDLYKRKAKYVNNKKLV